MLEAGVVSFQILEHGFCTDARLMANFHGGSVSVNLGPAIDPISVRVPSMLTPTYSAQMPLAARSRRSLGRGIFVIPVALCLTSVALAQSAGETLPTLTEVEQVRKLRPEEAAKGYPVKIHGVVTMDAPSPDFFVQDGTAGIYVEGNTSQRFIHALGRSVEVVGITGPGKFAPVIREQNFRDLGPGTLPPAPLLEFSELADGQQDSQWIQVRGIVRSASIDRGSWREPVLALRVASDGGELSVRVPVQNEPSLSSWIDSEILIEGVCGSLYNVSRQLTGILLYVPRLAFIKIEEQAPEVPLSGLLLFSPGEG